MASKIAVSFSGDLQLAVDPACGTSPGSPSAPSAYIPQLLSSNLQADLMAGSILGCVDSAAAFVSLGVPSNLQGSAFYLRSLNANEELEVRLTLAVAGQVVLPLSGMVLYEPTSADYITAVEVQGVGEFEWALWGAKG